MRLLIISSKQNEAPHYFFRKNEALHYVFRKKTAFFYCRNNISRIIEVTSPSASLLFQKK